MTNETPLYKILEHGQSCHGGRFIWSLPTREEDGRWTPGRWQSDYCDTDEPISCCHNGLHLTTNPVKWLTWSAQIYLAEGAGDSDRDDDKIAYRSARLLAEVAAPTWWQRAHQFVEQEIPAVRWFQPNGLPDSEWRLFTGSTWDAAWADARAAAWDAARAAARADARADAWDAAWADARAAAWNAARADARADAWDAAWNAAWDAAWDAARDAAWNAARDAALYAKLLICSDLPIPEHHRRHVEQRWQVWKSGYALLCDVNGILYVYAAEGT